jgi:hypothetical protein
MRNSVISAAAQKSSAIRKDSLRDLRGSNQQDGHANSAFDVSTAELLALSATGFSNDEAIPHRA